jgi:hypothetical protein
MPYAIRVFDRAVELLGQLLEDVPPERWDAIGEAIEAVLNDFASLPTRQRPSSLILPLHFEANGVHYRWLFSWKYEETEQTIDITGFGRDSGTIL